MHQSEMFFAIADYYRRPFGIVSLSIVMPEPVHGQYHAHQHTYTSTLSRTPTYTHYTITDSNTTLSSTCLHHRVHSYNLTNTNKYTRTRHLQGDDTYKRTASPIPTRTPTRPQYVHPYTIMASNTYTRTPSRTQYVHTYTTRPPSTYRDRKNCYDSSA